jgi:glycosyltransferase involved in cell wall biosynthesis
VATLLVISLSDLASDPRVDRQIDFLRGQHRVIAAGFGRPAYEDVEYLELERADLPAPAREADRAVRVARALIGLHRSAYWSDPNHRLWRRALDGLGADLVIVNDAIVLPVAFAVAGDTPVLFDAHEYSPSEFETSWAWRRFVRPRVRWVCGRYLPRVAGMMAVSRGIADRYEREFGVSPVVVTNASRYEALAPTPIDDPIRLVHFGWPDPQRRLQDTLAAMELLDEHYSLDLYLVVGDASRRHLEQLKERAGGDPRIRFRDPVPMRSIPSVANAYDIGVFLLPPQHVNQEFTLPNKLFEYIQGRIIPAIGPSPEMARVVRKWDCGIVAEDFTPAAFAAAIAGCTVEPYATTRASGFGPPAWTIRPFPIGSGRPGSRGTPTAAPRG